MKTPILLLTLASLPLFFTGHQALGASAVVGCLALAYIMDDEKSKRLLDLGANEILNEMVFWEKQQSLSSDSARASGRHFILIRLGELYRKYEEEYLNTENLALLCQQAAYIGLRNFPTDSHVVARSLSVLALVAKDSDVRQRHLKDTDHYSIALPIWCMRQALLRARHDKKYATELGESDLPCKACHLLAALSDGDSDMARLIIQEGGLETMFEAAKWYRDHSEVAHMSLMALFHLRSVGDGEDDEGKNKLASVDIDAISIVIQLMRHCPDSVQVARYGMTILFDVLDGDDQSPQDLMEIRNDAVNEGLHEAVLSVMNKFPSDDKIKTIGQDILASTDYSFQGAVPEYGYHPVGK